MFTFLLVVQAIIAAALVTVILMQRSEGGGLAGGGSPAGFMSARGAADFLTRTTSILATIFVALSIVLAVLASMSHRGSTIDTSLANGAAPVSAPGQPASDDPLAAAAAAAAAGNGSAPANSGGGIPLQQ